MRTSHSSSTRAVRAVLQLALFGGVADRFQLEPMRIEPVGRKTVFPVLGKLAWLVQDDGLTSTRPLVRVPHDRPARNQEREVMEAGPAACVRSRLRCLVEEQL